MSRYFEAVHAIEPNPRSYEVLALNSNLAENIHCHQVAASDTNGTLRFEQEAGNIGGTYVLPEGWQPGVRVDPSETVTLNHQLRPTKQDANCGRASES
ncbi:hypothetical protein [Variovorax sp. LjRoot84]|uniref:hypothetical protein n=1 Tax=Variovorax sp. LjRoot84 TaxID=3342340 RepID=UPI003F514BAE